MELLWRDTTRHVTTHPDGNVIMRIIKQSSCRLLWNGECMVKIGPTRGLRQGDPLSPYHFVLYMERFNQWIATRVAEGTWRPLRASRGSVLISHLLYTDDIILFAEATLDQVLCIKEGLSLFCKASGQSVNMNKSIIFFLLTSMIR